MEKGEYSPALADLIATGYGLKPVAGQAWEDFVAQQLKIEFDEVDDVLLIQQECQPIGSLSLKISNTEGEKTVYIQGIVVKPEQQKKGLGTQLLEMMLEKYHPAVIYGETNSLSLVKTLLKFSEQYKLALIWGFIMAGDYCKTTQKKLNHLVEVDGGPIQAVDPAIMLPLPIENLLEFPGNFKFTVGTIVKQQLKTKQPHCAPFVLIPLTAEDEWLKQTKTTIKDVLPYKTDPSATLISEKLQEAKRLQKEKLQLEFELNILCQSLPKELLLESVNLWLSLRKFMDIPKVGDPYQEIKHPFGPVKTFAVGLLKSIKYGQPKLELHGTVCPNYIPKELWGTGHSDICTNHIVPAKLTNLQIFTGVLQPFSGKYYDELLFHTPSPFDRDCDFCDHMEESVLKVKNGQDQLGDHWQMMQNLAQQVPGLKIVPDLPYLTEFLNKEKAEELMQNDQQLQNAFKEFINSQYVYYAYLQWGPISKFSIWAGLYLGTVMAYGNHESVFDLNNSAPIKLYLNCEEKNGPETFAGAYTGVDVRHILAKYGYHLPLLVADNRLRTPWLED